MKRIRFPKEHVFDLMSIMKKWRLGLIIGI